MKVTKLLPLCLLALTFAFASCTTTKAEEVTPAAETTVEMAEITPAETTEVPAEEVVEATTEEIAE